MRQIAIYGKGGIGKSTTTQNLAASLAGKGKKIMLLGCDPKADSTRLILGRSGTETILDKIRREEELSLDRLLETGCGGILTAECGGPDPGIGCAGRGIVSAIELLEEAGAYDQELDYVFYDVLGDVVCGGFAMPIRKGKAKEIYIVCSGEMMALYAANNICRGIERFAKTGPARLGGLICNERLVEREKELVCEFAERINTRVIAFLPRDNAVQRAELAKRPVAAAEPESRIAKAYEELAAAVEENRDLRIPEPMDLKALEDLAEKYLF